jgi:hypothetical protein
MTEKTEHEKLTDLLIEAGFNGGWVLQGEILILWEHEIEPPAPLTRPA